MAMYIKTFNIRNYKAFENTTLHFNETLNVFTGTNNSGKTTLLEAIALWSECFRKLINRAQRSQSNYSKDDYVFGPSNNRYFDFEEINSVRSPYFEDIFRDRNKKNSIRLAAVIYMNPGVEMEIGFRISDSTGRYVIQLENHAQFDYLSFNRHFRRLPNAIGTYYASPVSIIEQREEFATDPQIYEAINLRKSSSVIRNRLYRLYIDTDLDRYRKFEADLSYILFQNASAKLTFHNKSDIRQDTRVRINYTLSERDYEKDIALLGSGSLQVIEILLNIYQQAAEPRDLNLVLLDEPDSHIHRHIQQRLLRKLIDFSLNNQIFLTTHNEAFIRSCTPRQLFHIQSDRSHIQSIYAADLPPSGVHRFRGIYPTATGHIVRSLGNGLGLDFVSAIEADRIVFVEGETDARLIHRLLQEVPGGPQRNIVYWVLGSVADIFDKIGAYRIFFSDIRNEKSLWEKSFLVFDKDDLIDEHARMLSELIRTQLQLPHHITHAYTQEAVLFSQPDQLSALLLRFLANNYPQASVQETELRQNVHQHYLVQGEAILRRLENADKSKLVDEYMGRYQKKFAQMFTGKLSFETKLVKLSELIHEETNRLIQNQQHYKLMRKEDVHQTLARILETVGIAYSANTDFDLILHQIGPGTWYSEWDFVRQI